MKSILIRLVKPAAATLYRVGYLFGVLLMIVMILTLSAGVVSRYIFQRPIFWTVELARIVLIWTIFVGAALALRKGSIADHISMDFVVARLKGRGRRTIDKIVLILELVFCVCALIIGIAFVARTHRTITAALEVSRAVIYLALPVFSVMSVFFILERLFSPSEEDSLQEADDGASET